MRSVSDRVSRQARSLGFTVDDTPPVAGKAALRLLYPRRFEKQANFPASIRNLVLRVRVSGFGDDESGIQEHRIRLLVNGTELAAGSLPSGRDGLLPYAFDGLPEILNGSTIVASVVGVNRVGLETGMLLPLESKTLDARAYSWSLVRSRVAKLPSRRRPLPSISAPLSSTTRGLRAASTRRGAQRTGSAF